MRYTRREAGKLALSALPAASMLVRPLPLAAQNRPNSTINGVRVGAITYSYRTMADQSAEAILRYVVDSGISQIEFMGGPVEAFAGAPPGPAAGGGRRGGQPPTPEQQAAQREAADKLKAWRTSVVDGPLQGAAQDVQRRGRHDLRVEAARPNMSDEEFEYIFDVAEALGCTHTTLELHRRRRATEADWRVRRETENLRGVSHASAGKHVGVRPGLRGIEGEHGQRRPRALRGGRRRSRGVSREVPRPYRELPPERPYDPRARPEEPSVGHRAIRRWLRCSR